MCARSKTRSSRRASWIWMAGRRRRIDCHLLFRREFRLAARPVEGRLRIAASDQYRLFVNGRRVGDGPARGEIPTAYVDTYELASLPLRKGANCIAVLAHNTMLPQHGQALVPGGLWVDLECRSRSGKAARIVSDEAWRAIEAPQYRKPAPRRFFAVGFNEDVLLAAEPQGWTKARFNDGGWKPAGIVPARPLTRLVDRPIPLFRFEEWRPARIRCHGTADYPRHVWGLCFESCTSRDRLPARKEMTFGTYIHSDRARTVQFAFGCDNWSRLRINGKLVWEQGSPDAGFRNHMKDEDVESYPGMVQGNGHRFEPERSRGAQRDYSQQVRLAKGWNRLTVWMWRPHTTYGFELCFLDPRTGLPVSTVCSATKDTEIRKTNTWVLLSEESTPIDRGRAWAPLSWSMHAALEPSHLWDWAVRKPSQRPPAGAASLLAKPRGKGPLRLQPGQYVELELPADGVGFIDLELRGPNCSVVDVTIGEAQTPDGRLRSLYNGLWQTDQLVLSGKWDRWLSLDRRAGRYLGLVVRDGGPVEVRKLALLTQHYATERLGRFECDDWTLTRMWQAGARTVDAATFDVAEDCPTREKAQWGGDTYLRLWEMAYLWGDLRLSAKALREFAEDQRSDRWCRPMVPSGYGDKLVDYCFLLPVWVREHYLFDADMQLVRDTFGGVKNLLSYAHGLENRHGFATQGDDRRNILYIDYSMQPYPRCGDVIGMMQCAYVMALEDGAVLAEMLGEDELAAEWRARAADVRDKTRRVFWVPREGLFADGLRKGKPGGTFSAVSNYWMMLAQIATPEQEACILKKLWHSPKRENMKYWQRGESPYSKFFMSEALLRRGLWRQAFASWRGYYGTMLRHFEAWSVFEMWRRSLPLDKPMQTNSLVHPFAIGPMAHLMSYVAGVRPLGPGADGILWEPMPGDLKRMIAEVPIVGRDEIVTVEMTPRRGGGRRLVLSGAGGLPVRTSRRYLAPRDEMIVHLPPNG